MKKNKDKVKIQDIPESTGGVGVSSRFEPGSKSTGSRGDVGSVSNEAFSSFSAKGSKSDTVTKLNLHYHLQFHCDT